MLELRSMLKWSSSTYGVAKAKQHRERGRKQEGKKIGGGEKRRGGNQEGGKEEGGKKGGMKTWGMKKGGMKIGFTFDNSIHDRPTPQFPLLGVYIFITTHAVVRMSLPRNS